MKLLIEFIKLAIELIIILIVSKKVLVPVLRNLAESLELKSHAVGTISGIATSMPELLTVTFASISGMLETSVYNVFSSNLINIILYITSIIVNKNLKQINNKSIKINMILVLFTIIIPIILIIFKIENNIYVVPIFIILFLTFYMINRNAHSKYMNKENDNMNISAKHKRNMKSILKYIIYIIMIGVILFIVGNFLSNTLQNLCYIFNIPEILIGIILGFSTSIPELITFVESQRFHKGKEDVLGLVEASNNLIISNTSNLFIIQSIGIVLFQIFGIK